MRLGQAPTVLVLGGVAAGLAVVALLDWRLGSSVVGLAVVLGGALRLTLPDRSAGLLAVRSRGVDAGLLLLVGAAVLVLANTVPQP